MKTEFQRRFQTWKWKENVQKKDQDKDGNNRLGKMLHRVKEGYGKTLRTRSCGKTEIDEEAWLSDDPLKVEMS
jgi:hypothetical protein